MDISQNNLSGKIPEPLKSLKSLQYLNLSFNHFHGAVPRGGIFDIAGAVSVEGNYHLCTSIPIGGMPLCSALVDKKRKHKSLVLVLEMVLPIVVVTIIILSCIVIIYRKKRMQANPHLQHVNEHIKNISYEDVVRATNRFSYANLIGSGSFGRVYKGSLQFQEDQVAIKIFDLDIYGAHRSFIAEYEALRNVRHPNLLKIIASCSSVDHTRADFKALVFPYMPNGNLEMWLHPADHEHGERNILSLSQRINQDETIEHLFLHCPLAKLLWRTIHVSFNVAPPISVSHLFGTWLTGIEPKTTAHIRVGVCALLWAIWNCQNDVAFNRQTITNFLQVIFRASAWIHTWSLLCHADHREIMDIGCNQWEMVAWDTYNRFGWRSNNRIGV